MSNSNPSVVAAPGDPVRIVIDARYITTDLNGHHEFEAVTESGGPYQMYVWSQVPARYERIYPVEWPPRGGDVWEDARGQEWFGVFPGRDAVELVGTFAARTPAVRVAELYGPLRLVRRREPATGGTLPAPVLGDGTAPAGYAADRPVLNGPAALGGEQVEDYDGPVGSLSGRGLPLTGSGDLVASDWRRTRAEADAPLSGEGGEFVG